MNKFNNYYIYKLGGPKFKGYIFSVQEQTDEEPIYHYYFITTENEKKPKLLKPNNTIHILDWQELEIIDINDQPDELLEFSSTMQIALNTSTISLKKNSYFSNVNSKDIQLLKRI